MGAWNQRRASEESSTLPATRRQRRYEADEELREVTKNAKSMVCARRKEAWCVQGPGISPGDLGSMIKGKHVAKYGRTAR
jgi:hypothetical protein